MAENRRGLNSQNRNISLFSKKREMLVRAVGSTPGQNNRITFITYVSAITFAEHSVHLTNAYFIPDDQILEAFTDAASAVLT